MMSKGVLEKGGNKRTSFALKMKVEKYLEKGRNLFAVFMDLAKSHNRVH